MQKFFRPLVSFILALALAGPLAKAANESLIANGELLDRSGFKLSGSASYTFLGDPRRDMSSYGVALDSTGRSGAVSIGVRNLGPSAGRWFRLTFRGLPQANFAVTNDDLYIRIAYFGENGVSYDAKTKHIYDQIETARKDLNANGTPRQGGAEVWQTYQMDFMLPFPQVDQIEITVGFGQGSSRSSRDSAFFVDDLRLVRIPDPGNYAKPNVPAAIVPAGKLLPLGGRWFYAAKDGETSAPRKFDGSNADRLLYRDAVYSAPFAGNTSAWLRAGYADSNGDVVRQARLLTDNVTIEFTGDALVIRSKGIPNHPTGRFPEEGRGNPSYIGEQRGTFYIPLEPRESSRRVVTNKDNSNGALHMGPIGVAVNGVVFFNPFDMGNQDATNMMDRCCGHPNQMAQYHYHKYPVCVNTPWADEGKAHSPLLGWAFDGYPLYGPYERENVMAKDIRGEGALNAFNAHYDAERGWHYHVTPGQFPYLIGGFWGVEDERNVQRPGPGRGGSPDRNNARGPNRGERLGPLPGR